MAAWVALGVSIVALVLGEVRYRQTRKSFRDIGPAPEVRAALTAARDGFGEIITSGGASTKWFLDESRRNREQELIDAAARVGNAELRAAIEGVAASWKAAFGAAPAPRGMRAYSLEDPPNPAYAREDARRAEMNAQLVDLARSGKAGADEAIAILNRLEARIASVT